MSWVENERPRSQRGNDERSYLLFKYSHEEEKKRIGFIRKEWSFLEMGLISKEQAREIHLRSLLSSFSLGEKARVREAQKRRNSFFTANEPPVGKHRSDLPGDFHLRLGLPWIGQFRGRAGQGVGVDFHPPLQVAQKSQAPVTRLKVHGGRLSSKSVHLIQLAQ